MDEPLLNELIGGEDSVVTKYLKRDVVVDEPYAGIDLGSHAAVDQLLKIHPLPSPRIVINFPGANGPVDHRFEPVAEMLRHNRIGAVIRSDNYIVDYLYYPDDVQNKLRSITQYALDYSQEVCGYKNPAVYMAGYSAGASAISAVVSEYLQVEKVLLIAPSYDAGKRATLDGITEYTGELYIVVGEDDPVVSTVPARAIYEAALQTRQRRLEIIPDCAHDFKGSRNEAIFSSAYLWAFSGDTSFPLP